MFEPLYVKEVNIEKLFDMYNYSIKFDTPASIIMGPNGVGKSLILKLISDTVTGIKCNIPAADSKVILTSGEELTPDTCRKAVSVYQVKMISDLNICLKGIEYNADQINEFTSIVNETFEITRKKIMPKDQGFIITRNDKEISYDVLSPNEQYFISLFFGLIFEAKNCLVLIDNFGEGLHIEVQEHLIHYLWSITSLNQLQIIVVTHSPSVISDSTKSIAYFNVDLVD